MATPRSTQYPFNRSRTPPPQVFENNLDRDSDDESDKVREVHTEPEFDNTDGRRKRDITNAISKPNFTSRQLSNETKPGHTIGLSHSPDTSFMHGQYNGQEDGTLVGGYKADRNPGELDNTSNLIPDGCMSHSLPGKQSGDVTKEGNQPNKWTSSWTLEEDDLMEMGGFVDPTIRIDPYLSRSAQTSIKGNNETIKVNWGISQKYPRIYHTRASRESFNDMKSKLGRSIMQSPLAILARMAGQVNMDPTSLLDKYDSMGLNKIMPVRFPCMQCYEKQETSDESYYSKTADAYYDDYGYDYVDEDKCKRTFSVNTVPPDATFLCLLLESSSRRLSNSIVEKGEIACDKQFLLLPQYFFNLSIYYNSRSERVFT